MIAGSICRSLWRALNFVVPLSQWTIIVSFLCRLVLITYGTYLHLHQTASRCQQSLWPHWRLEDTFCRVKDNLLRRHCPCSIQKGIKKTTTLWSWDIFWSPFRHALISPLLNQNWHRSSLFSGSQLSRNSSPNVPNLSLSPFRARPSSRSFDWEDRIKSLAHEAAP